MFAAAGLEDGATATARAGAAFALSDRAELGCVCGPDCGEGGVGCDAANAGDAEGWGGNGSGFAIVAGTATEVMGALGVAVGAGSGSTEATCSAAGESACATARTETVFTRTGRIGSIEPDVARPAVADGSAREAASCA